MDDLDDQDLKEMNAHLFVNSASLCTSQHDDTEDLLFSDEDDLVNRDNPIKAENTNLEQLSDSELLENDSSNSCDENSELIHSNNSKRRKVNDAKSLGENEAHSPEPLIDPIKEEMSDSNNCLHDDMDDQDLREMNPHLFTNSAATGMPNDDDTEVLLFSDDDIPMNDDDVIGDDCSNLSESVKNELDDDPSKLSTENSEQFESNHSKILKVNHVASSASNEKARKPILVKLPMKKNTSVSDSSSSGASKNEKTYSKITFENIPKEQIEKKLPTSNTSSVGDNQPSNASITEESPALNRGARGLCNDPLKQKSSNPVHQKITMVSTTPIDEMPTGSIRIMILGDSLASTMAANFSDDILKEYYQKYRGTNISHCQVNSESVDHTNPLNHFTKQAGKGHYKDYNLVMFVGLSSEGWNIDRKHPTLLRPKKIPTTNDLRIRVKLLHLQLIASNPNVTFCIWIPPVLDYGEFVLKRRRASRGLKKPQYIQQLFKHSTNLICKLNELRHFMFMNGRPIYFLRGNVVIRNGKPAYREHYDHWVAKRQTHLNIPSYFLDGVNPTNEFIKEMWESLFDLVLTHLVPTEINLGVSQLVETQKNVATKRSSSLDSSDDKPKRNRPNSSSPSPAPTLPVVATRGSIPNNCPRNEGNISSSSSGRFSSPKELKTPTNEEISHIVGRYKHLVDEIGKYAHSRGIKMRVLDYFKYLNLALEDVESG